MSGLQELIDQQRIESFRPGAEVSDEEVLGVLIARYLGFGPTAILETAIAALVDANAVGYAARVQALLAGS